MKKSKFLNKSIQNKLSKSKFGKIKSGNKIVANIAIKSVDIFYSPYSNYKPYVEFKAVRIMNKKNQQLSLQSLYNGNNNLKLIINDDNNIPIITFKNVQFQSMFYEISATGMVSDEYIFRCVS